MVTFLLYTGSGSAKRKKSGLVPRIVFSRVLLANAATASRKRTAGLNLGAFDRFRTVPAHDTPVEVESTAQRDKSRAVESHARVNGYLDRRAYAEGGRLYPGRSRVLMERGPFGAALQIAKHTLAPRQARAAMATANRVRIGRVASQHPISRWNYAIGNDKKGEGAVVAAKGQVPRGNAGVQA